MSTVCQYLTLHCVLVLCHCVHCWFVESVYCLLVSKNVPSLGFVSLCQLLSSTVCPLPVSTSKCTVCWFCVVMSTAEFCSLCTVSQYLTIKRLLILCHYVHCCLLQSVHCLSVPHTVPPVGSVSLFPLLPSTVRPVSVGTSHITVCNFFVTVPIFVF